MADRKITELDEAGALTGVEVIALVQGGATRRATLNALKGLVLATVPAAFEVGDWSVARGNAVAAVTIGSLPYDGGAAITGVQYRVDGGAWISSAGTGNFSIASLTNGVEYEIQLRAINTVGASGASDAKSVTPATVPGAFGTDDWSIAAGDQAADVAIISLPANGGATIADIEYRLDGGTWVSSGGAVSFAISGLANDQEYGVELRAVNNVGAGAASDVKQVEPEAPSDTTAPTLSSPFAVEDGHDAADLSVSTNEANGTLYWVVTTSATQPSAARVKAGQDHTGAAAADSGSVVVSSTGTQTDSAAGLAENTTYHAHFMHEDVASNQSDVATSASFTTESEAAATFEAQVIALLGAKLRAFWLYDDPTTLRQNSDGSTAVATDTDPVGYVTDLSGNGKHMIQTTSSSKPAYRAGSSRVMFDGVNDYLTVPSAAFPVDAYELFQVFDQHAAGGNNVGLYAFAPSSGNDYTGDTIAYHLGTGTNYWVVEGAPSQTINTSHAGSGNAPLALYESEKTATTINLIMNGTVGATDSSFTALTSPHTGSFWDGCRYISSAPGFYAPLARRCTIMTAPLTSGERSDLRALINGRYALW